ncbi:metabotropic glutamate receptor 3-like [Paramuricea clavata]|uniref:Metabotropic glutamate receptor 3-like n=2 Tax=Paramuricea clavata TaxID=317549 RepID=A0A7D9K7C8_PARCT|nr:metabotropic glutamate receptor 3-like [Paramuricea clavata]
MNNKTTQVLFEFFQARYNLTNFLIADYEEVAKGTFTFGHRQGSIPEFEEYFHALRYNNYTRSNKYWIGEYWQETHQCNLPKLGIPANFTKNCTGDENNAIYKEFAPVQLVINAVYALANALNSLQKHSCPNITGICSEMRPISTQLLLEYIKNTTFEDALSHSKASFNSRQEVEGNYTVYNYRYINGSYDYIPVGSWSAITNNTLTENLVLNESVVQSAHVNAVIPLFACRPTCGHGQIRVSHRPGSGPGCCWVCRTCAENEAVMNNTCQACVPGFTPGKNLSSCLKMDLIYINMDTPLAIVLAVFSVLGIITDFVFLTAFIVYRNHPLIKASGREMCCVIFGGIATIFITPLTTLVKPTPGICSTRRILAGISFTICYAPLLMKIWRIHKIFQRANKLKRASSGGLLGLAPMMGLTFVIVVINALYSASISSIDPTEVVEKFYKDKEELVLECTTSATVFASIFAYNMMLVLGCTLYAFLTRHFPKNFNEAMYIGMTLYLTCVVWVVFFANYLNSADSISRVYWLSGSSLLIGWITLLGLFGPKFYHVYTKPEVSREMLITWSESSRRRSEDISGRCEECRRRAEALKMYSNGIGTNDASLRKHSNGIGRSDSSLRKQSNGIGRNDSSLRKQSNSIDRSDSSLSKPTGNDSSATLREIGIDNLADTHM